MVLQRDLKLSMWSARDSSSPCWYWNNLALASCSASCDDMFSSIWFLRVFISIRRVTTSLLSSKALYLGLDLNLFCSNLLHWPQTTLYSEASVVSRLRFSFMYCRISSLYRVSSDDVLSFGGSGFTITVFLVGRREFLNV